MAAFDPYHIWLGIPPEDQPPSHYRLLAIPELESNPDVIDTAAERQTLLLRTFQTGDQAELAEQLLNEVSAARVCLLDVEQKAEYDQQLQAEMQPALVPIPALVQNDPLGIAALQTTPAVPLPSRRTQPIWQQPRMLAVAGGAVVVILLVAVLNSGGDKASVEKVAAAKAAMDKAVAELAAAEREGERLTAELAATGTAAAEHEALRLATELATELAAEEAAAKREADKLAAEEAAAKAAMEKAAAEPLTLKGHSSVVLSVAFSPDGRRIVSGSLDKTLKVWDAETGQEMLTLKGHSDVVTSVAFSPDGKWIVSGTHSMVKVWDAKTGQEKLALKKHTHYVRSTAFSPSGKQIVSCSDDGTIKVWNVDKTGQKTLTINGHSPYMGSAGFDPNGKRIVGACDDNTVKVWDATTGKVLITLRGHKDLVRSAAFSPDGKRIVSGSADDSSKVWDAATGQEMLELNGHSDDVYSVAFSPDGKQIVSASHDKTVKLWDATTGQEMLTLKGHSGKVHSVSFSPDGKRIVSGSGDNTVKVCNVPSLEANKAAMENSIGMKLALIPADEFQMGSPDSDSDSLSSEKPQHLVKITKPFYLGVYEVTQQQYEKVMGTRPWQGEGYVKEGSDYPAVNVRHDDAVEFCRRLSKQEGVEYRLPTEAEWEYACRAGTTTAYSFGDDEAKLGQYAWYYKNAWDIGEKYAHRVGQKLPNSWGLYDMHGNVWEWCQDWYAPYGSEKVVSDPVGPAQGEYRVLRGGSFTTHSSVVRSANRNGYQPDNRSDVYGFRAARTYSVSP